MKKQPRSAQLQKIKIQGTGNYKTPPSKPLDKNSKPGDIVSWGDNIGELREWEGNKAFIKTPYGTSAVEVA